MRILGCAGACAVGMMLSSAGCGSAREDAGPGQSRGAATVIASESITVRDVGFLTPESVLHDPLTDRYLVSNINGGPLDADDNGFISLLGDDGQVLALKWIDGASDSVTLNAPKGMAVVGEFLYVADITVIRRFDRRTGMPRGSTEIPGATFLNDVTATDDGMVYFTDSGLRAGTGGFESSGSDAVYRMHPEGPIDTLARGTELGGPNGIAVSGDTVWIATFRSGEIYRIANGARVDVFKPAKGGLDGLVYAFGELFVSSWDGEAVYRGKPGTLAEFLRGLKAPADIGHDIWRNRLLIPLFNDNEVRIVPLAL